MIPRVPHYLLTTTINNISKLTDNKVNLTIRRQSMQKIGSTQNRYILYDQFANQIGRVCFNRSEVYDQLRAIEDVLNILRREEKKIEVLNN